MPTAWNDFYTEAEKQNKSAWDKALADNTNLYGQQTTFANQSYDAQVSEAKGAYEDKYRENAIQKLINERQIAENMANLGLTNSGLNRTQQTAVQLSYANNKASIDKQRQSQIDALNLARTQDLNTIEQNRLAAEANINQKYQQLINETANNNYNTYVETENERLLAEMDAETEMLLAQIDAAAEVEKERIKAQKEEQKTNKQNSYIIKTNNGLLSRDLIGSLKDNGVDSYKITKNNEEYIRYVDNNSGKSVDVPIGVNPYTGDDNSALKEKYGVFSNGYQPKGVKGYGEFDKTTKGNVKSVDTVEFKGRNQNVFSITKKGKITYWVWDGANNEYFQVKNAGKNAKGQIKWEEV